MKQIYTLVILLCLAFLSFGQGPYLASIEISPQNPSTGDEVFLITHTATGNMGTYLGSEVNVNGNTITVKSCYFEGWATSPQHYFDTISLGHLYAGLNILSYQASITWNDTICYYQGSTDSVFTFEIQEFANIEEFATLQKLVVSPNPADHLISFESRGQSFSDYSVVDLLGKEVTELVITEAINDDRVQLNIAQLNSGTYYLKTPIGTAKFYRK